MSRPLRSAARSGTVEVKTKGTVMTDTNHDDASTLDKESGGAMPMPHGNDATAPLPSEDGAMPMPHGSDEEIPEWTGAQREDDPADDA